MVLFMGAMTPNNFRITDSREKGSYQFLLKRKHILMFWELNPGRQAPHVQFVSVTQWPLMHSLMNMYELFNFHQVKIVSSLFVSVVVT